MAKISFLSGLDKARSIISAIAKTITDAGGNAEELLSALDTNTPAAINKLKRIAAVLMEKPELGIIEGLVLAAKCNDYNENINDTNLPAASVPAIEGARLEHYGQNMSSNAVLVELKVKGRRAATAAEILLWAATHPEEQRKYWIVALGQVWADSDGDDLVVVLRGSVVYRCAYLYSFVYVWDARHRFLSLPL